jgi:hypothetical protein
MNLVQERHLAGRKGYLVMTIRSKTGLWGNIDGRCRHGLYGNHITTTTHHLITTHQARRRGRDATAGQLTQKRDFLGVMKTTP